MRVFYFFTIVPAFIIACLLTHCNVLKEKNDTNNEAFEGYITLGNRVFEDIDNNGQPIKPVQGKDSLLINASRKIFLKEHYLIDIMINTQFADGEYIRTDTSGYVFYNLKKQEYIKFAALTPDSRILARGKMQDNGSFSDAKEHDPMSAADTTWLTTAEVLIGEKKNILVGFLPPDSLVVEYGEYARRAKFWIEPSLVDFPLQVSYILSKKLNGGFVYKRQLPLADGKAVMVDSLNYQSAKLPNSILAIFEKWQGRMKNEK